MQKKTEKNKYDFPYKSLAASIVIHLLIITASILILSFNSDPSRASQVVEIYTRYMENEIPLEEESTEEEKPVDEKEPAEKEPEPEEIKEPEKEAEKEKAAPEYLNFSNADTTDLNQVYKEPTLNVSIRYPKGWTFLDQNRKNRLDGVTFWAATTQFNPPPYVHLEVKEKYLFNPSRYEKQMNLNDAVAYYNEPKELSGQVSQEFYIRTDSDVDFSLKLIMKGRNNFILYQPEFFGMLKTFRFGRTIF